MPHLAGTLGNDDWYTSDVTVTWGTTDPESNIASSSGCSTTAITADTPSTTLACTATNRSGLSTTSSVTIKRDATPPTVMFTGNAARYSVDDQVTIQCTAADALSALASDTCPRVDAPAYTFGVGTTTLSASATDNAGNTGYGSTTFNVAVTPSSLCNLTEQFIQNSTKYQRLSRVGRAVANASGMAVCRVLESILPRANPHLKAALLNMYDIRVETLARLGSLEDESGCDSRKPRRRAQRLGSTIQESVPPAAGLM